MEVRLVKRMKRESCNRKSNFTLKVEVWRRKKVSEKVLQN